MRLATHLVPGAGDIPQVTNLWDSMVELLETYLPEPWMRALVVLGASILVAWIARLVLSRLLARMASRTSGRTDDRLVETLQRPIFWTILLWGICAAEVIGGLPDAVTATSVAITQTILTLIWMVAAFRVLVALLEGLQGRVGRQNWLESRTIPLIENIGRILLVGLGAYVVLQIWDLDVAPWLASAGIVGIALGFAAKDTLANLFGGFFIIIDAPYQIGDYINLETGERGEVTKIGLRTTRLLTRDDIEVTIPNAQIASAKIVNEAGGKWEKSRIRIPVGVAYGSDVEQVRGLLLEAAGAVELVVPEPSARVRFRKLGTRRWTSSCWSGSPSPGSAVRPSTSC